MTQKSKKILERALDCFIGLLAVLAVALVVTMMCATEARAASSVIIPQTTLEMNENSVYNRGEVAYIPQAYGNAQLFVGDNNGKPLAVSDYSALRAVVPYELSKNDYFFQPSEGVTVVSNGVFMCEARTDDPTNLWVRIYPLANKTLSYAEERQWSTNLVIYGHDTANNDLRGWRLSQQKNNEGYLQYDFVGTGSTFVREDACFIGDIRVFSVLKDTENNINDLTKKTFLLKDDSGTYDLNTLRPWVRNLYNGNRGEDWHKYVAKSTVFFDGNFLTLDAKRDFSMRSQEGVFSMYAGVQPAYTIHTSGGDSASAFTCDAIKVMGTDKDLTDGFFTIDVSFLGVEIEDGVEVIDWSKVKILTSESVEPELAQWVEVPYTRSSMIQADTYSYYQLTVSTMGSSRRFYKVIVNETQSSIITMTLNADVVFERGVYMRGDDGVIYRLVANDGQLSLVRAGDEGTVVAGDLPAGYTGLDFIQSSGTQFIDTGIVPNYTTKVTAEFEVVQNASFMIFGSRKSAQAIDRFAFFYLNDSTLRTDVSNKQIVLDFAAAINTPYTIEMTGASVKINGEIFNLTTPVVDDSNYSLPMYIFGGNNNGTGGQLSKIRLYSFKIEKENGELLRDFIPATDEQGRPCLYDKISKQPFYNQGTGEFLY